MSEQSNKTPRSMSVVGPDGDYRGEQDDNNPCDRKPPPKPMCGSKEYHQPTETENADMVILHFRLKDPTADLPNLSDFQRVVANYIYDGRLDNLRRYSSTGDNPERAKIIMRNRFTILKTMISESTGRDHSAKQILLQALYDVVKPAKLFKFIEDDHKSSIHESIGGDPPPERALAQGMRPGPANSTIQPVASQPPQQSSLLYTTPHVHPAMLGAAANVHPAMFGAGAIFNNQLTAQQLLMYHGHYWQQQMAAAIHPSYLHGATSQCACGWRYWVASHRAHCWK